MGNKQKSCENYYEDYSSYSNNYNYNKYEKNESPSGEKENLINRIKNLNNLNVSTSEIEENIDFYKNNIVALNKINKIINNVKFSDTYYLTPLEILSRIVDESEIKGLPLAFTKKEKERVHNAPVCPKYAALPTKWEDLFKLEYDENILTKLYTQTEIDRVKKLYEGNDNYNKIDKNTYEYYDSEFRYKNREIKEEKTETYNEVDEQDKYEKEKEENKKILSKEEAIIELKQLKYFPFKEKEIKKI